MSAAAATLSHTQHHAPEVVLEGRQRQCVCEDGGRPDLPLLVQAARYVVVGRSDLLHGWDLNAAQHRMSSQQVSPLAGREEHDAYLCNAWRGKGMQYWMATPLRAAAFPICSSQVRAMVAFERVTFIHSNSLYSLPAERRRRQRGECRQCNDYGVRVRRTSPVRTHRAPTSVTMT